MRTLKFIVEGQTVKPDPRCDFSGLVPGTEGYLQAEFSFSKEWNNITKVVGFYSKLGNEYEPQPLKNNRTCMIPPDATNKRSFKLQVIGMQGDYTIRTDRFEVIQKGG